MAAADLEKKIHSAKHALKYIFPKQIRSPVHIHQPPLLTHQSQQISPLPNPNTTAPPSTSPRHHSLCPDQPTTVINHTEDKSLKLDYQLQTTATPTSLGRQTSQIRRWINVMLQSQESLIEVHHGSSTWDCKSIFLYL
jgi:hypothetical protein